MNNKPTVILLSGKSQHGKDYTSNILKKEIEKKNQKVLITHYADLLKYICKTFFNWDGNKNENGRSILQKVGTDVIRKQKPNYWVGFIKSIITMFPNEWDYILIPDTRFPNEIEEMKKCAEFDTISVRIHRPRFESSLTEKQKQHESETALDNYCFDYKITNDDYLHNDIAVFIDKHLNIMQTIFIDLDCTVLNTIKCIVDLYDEDFKYYSDYKKIPWTEVRTWNFTELKATTPEYLNSYFNQQRFFDKVEMFEDAKERIDELSNYYNIKFVSHGYSPNLRIKAEWVKKIFPYAEFIGVNLKEHLDKSCIDMSGGIFIDDLKNNLESSNADIKICFGETYKWNEEWMTNNYNKFNAYTWKAVKKIINSLK